MKWSSLSPNRLGCPPASWASSASPPGRWLLAHEAAHVVQALGSLTLFGRPVLGELLELPKRPEVPTPLPSRLERSDITALEALTAELRAWS
jgi:hypothetical protein